MRVPRFPMRYCLTCHARDRIVRDGLCIVCGNPPERDEQSDEQPEHVMAVA